MTNDKARDLLTMIEVKEPKELIVNSWWGSFVKDYKEALEMAIKALDQEPKTGHWYYDKERGATGIYAICSNCNEEIYQTGDFKYCPNCGAKME